MNYKQLRSSGFTIVELLIVIVVIAILAAITVVAYNGITGQARQAAMRTATEQAVKQIEAYRVTNDVYPASTALVNEGQGLKGSEDIVFTYTTEAENYCLTVSSTQHTVAYNRCSNTGTINEGIYSGHTSLVAGYPSRGGFTNITNSYGTVNTDSNAADISAIPNGAWMIVVTAYFSGQNPVTPAGWTPLVVRKTTNTLQTTIYAKIKQSSDAAIQEFDASGSNGILFTNAVILWGLNAAPVANWTLGSFGDRITNATSTTVVTPTISVPTAKSLVLSIATERTSAAESNYVSLTGVTPWVWIPQPDANKMQTIAIGYSEQASPGASLPMTVTYPNPQSYNGTGIQIAIPPAS